MDDETYIPPSIEKKNARIRIDPPRGQFADRSSEISYKGLKILFPYNPYPEQVKYIEAVVDACEGETNAMLESPTGTGKTLSLLCASLGWLHHRRETVAEAASPKIIYLSRTHSQLIQVTKELKKTQYVPFTITLGSRDMLCVNPEVNIYQGTQLTVACKKLKKQNLCPFARGRSSKLTEMKNKIMDIEDLVEFGKRNSVCPFYGTRETLHYADLILMPYNYLIDSKIRGLYKNILGL